MVQQYYCCTRHILSEPCFCWLFTFLARWLVLRSRQLNSKMASGLKHSPRMLKFCPVLPTTSHAPQKAPVVNRCGHGRCIELLIEPVDSFPYQHANPKALLFAVTMRTHTPPFWLLTGTSLLNRESESWRRKRALRSWKCDFWLSEQRSLFVL